MLGQPSVVPPGVTCSYQMEAGTLVTGDEWWAPALIVSSLVNAVVLTLALRGARSLQASNPPGAP